MIEVIGVISFIYLVLAITFWSIYFICWLIKKICKGIWFIISFPFKSENNISETEDYISDYIKTEDFNNSSYAKKKLITNMQKGRKLFIDTYGEVIGESLWQTYLQNELKNTKI